MSRFIAPSTISVLLAVLAVSLYGSGGDAFADHHIRIHDEPVWSGSLNTSIVHDNARGCHGSGNRACSSILDPHTFTYNGTTYNIVALFYSVGSNILSLELDRYIPVMPDPVLVVGGMSFDFAYEEDIAQTAMRWFNANLNWPRGALMEISIVPSRNYLISDDFGLELYYEGRDYTVDGLLLKLPAEDGSDTFQVRLTEDPGSATIAVNFLTTIQNHPYGASDHNWSFAATITPETITFTTSNWNDFQNVTVTGVPDDDYSPEQMIIVAVPNPSIGRGHMTGVYVTIADPCTTCSTAGEEGAIPIPPGFVITESAQLPVITLMGSTNMTIQINSTWTEPGYTATNSDGNDITGNVTISGAVDTSQEGTYLLYYQVADAYGTPATPQIRTVNVIAVQPQYVEPEPVPEPQPQQNAEPEPVPEPEQEPEPEPDIPGIVRQYDTDGSGIIEQDEWLVAIDDYVDYKLTTPQIQQIAAHRG